MHGLQALVGSPFLDAGRRAQPHPLRCGSHNPIRHGHEPWARGVVPVPNSDKGSVL